MFPSPFPLYIFVSRGEKGERMWGVVLLFHSYRYSSPKIWSTNGSMSLLSPVFFCELLWVLWSRIWVCISLISVASVVSVFFCWLTHYIFTWILTTVWPHFPRCVNTHVFSFTADTCLSLDFRLVVFPVTSNLWWIVKTCKSEDCPSWLVWWRMQCFINKTSFLQSKKKLKVTTL